MKKSLCFVLTVLMFFSLLSPILYAEALNYISVTVDNQNVTFFGTLDKSLYPFTFEVKRVSDGARKYIAQGETDKNGNYSLNNIPSDIGNYSAEVCWGMKHADTAFVVGNAPTKPGTPTGLNVSATTTNSVKLSWNNVADATGYKLYKLDSANGSYSIVYTGTETSAIITDLQAGQTYYFKVSAINIGGESALSDAVAGSTVSSGSSNSGGSGGGVGKHKGSSRSSNQNTVNSSYGNITLTKDAGGLIVATLQVDNSKLKTQLNDKNSAAVKIELNVVSDKTNVIMDAKTFNSIAADGKTVDIIIHGAAFKLDPAAIPLVEGAKLNLGVNKLNVSNTQSIIAKSKAQSFNLVSTVLEFDLSSVIGNSQTKQALKKPLTVQLPFDASKVQDPKKTGVYFYNETSAVWEYAGGRYTGNGFITAELDHFSKYAVMEFNKNFKDINNSFSWAKDQIEILASRHIVSGDDSGNFKPEQYVTRAEFAEMLTCALQLKAEDQKVSFSDVNDNAWYKDGVQTTAALGLINGCGTKFNPDEEMTREMVGVLLVRTMKYANPKVEYSNKNSLSFKDSDKISGWAKDELAIAFDKGLISGMPDNRFDPAGKVSKAQAAVFIYRLLEVTERL